MTYHLIDWFDCVPSWKPVEVGTYATLKEAKKALSDYVDECDGECDCEIVEKDDSEEI